MLTTNWLLEKLKANSEPCMGTWITLPSPELVDVICSAGPDFVVIDSEHAPLSLETAQLMTIVCTSRQVSPVFRVPGAMSDRIVPALEIGSHAIQAPNISSAKEVEFFVKASRYSPGGSKGLSPYTKACNYSAEFAGRMTLTANQNTQLIIQVEDKASATTASMNEDLVRIQEEDSLVGVYKITMELQDDGTIESLKPLKKKVVSGLEELIENKKLRIGTMNIRK